MAFFVPIQGLLNLIILPEVQTLLEKKSDQFFVRTWFQMIWAKLGCGTKSSSEAVSPARSWVRFSWRPLFAWPSIDQRATAVAAASSTTADKVEPGQEIAVNHEIYYDILWFLATWETM
jgi:hypothetical protein